MSPKPPEKMPPLIRISWEENEPPADLDEEKLLQAGQGFLSALGLSDVAVNVLVAGDETLADLNTRFRGKAQPTDVLSWSYGDPPGEEIPDEGEPPLFGEIAISLQQVRGQAAENQWDAHTEFLRLLAHGCTHLAGYDHETEEEERVMRAIEIRLLGETGLTGLYPE